MSHTANPRYFRIDISPGNWQVGTGVWELLPGRTSYRKAPDVLIEHELPVKGKSRTILGTAGKCIYCDATIFNNSGAPPSEEHVISEMFGAAVVLLKASCERCASATSAAESRVVQLMFDPTRKRLGIRGKNRALKKNKFRVFVTKDGIEEEVLLPSDVHPTVLFMPIFLPPAAMTDRPIRAESFQGYCAININVRPEILDAQKIQKFASSRVDTLSFCQLIAKIAHSYASSVLLPGSFVPTLREFIRTNFKKKDDMAPDRYQYIGGITGIEPRTRNLHELGLGSVHIDGRTLLLVRIRLFAVLNCPTYFVVIGYRDEAPP